MVALAKSREAAARRRNPFAPFAHLLANLLLCAVCERYLASDTDGVFLPVFIAGQCMLALLITLSFVGGTGAEIVRKTRLLPGPPSAAASFLVAGSLRRPELLFFAAVGCAAPAFVFGGGPAAVAGMAVAAALPVVTTQLLCCSIAARMIRSDRPLTGLTIVAAGVTAAAVASLFVFRTKALASAIPVTGWAASSIRALAAGRTGDAVVDLLLLAAALGAALALSRK